MKNVHFVNEILSKYVLFTWDEIKIKFKMNCVLRD